MNPEVAHALALAQRKYGNGLQLAVPRPEFKTRNGVPNGHKVQPPVAFASGVENRRLGMGRVSPYYNAPKSDHFWFAGYDGKTMQEAIETQGT